jgi:hypothetical protein
VSFHLENPFIILSAVPSTTILVGFIDIEVLILITYPEPFPAFQALIDKKLTGG